MKNISPKVVITTQEKVQASRFMNYFTENKFSVRNFPMISIETVKLNEEIRNQFDKIQSFDWLVFTSRNGVKAFKNLWSEYSDNPLNLSNKIAAIGSSTAKMLEENGLTVDFVNPGTTSGEFMYHIDDQEIITNVDSVLLVLGNLAPETLKLKLKEITPRVQRMNVYQTQYVKNEYLELNELIRKDNYSIIVFTSPSAFDNFLRNYGEYITDKSKLRIASIGKTTSRFIELKGFSITLNSPKSTLQDLAQIVVTYLKN